MTVTHLMEREPWDSGFIPMDQLLEQKVMDETSTLTEDSVLYV